MMRRLVNKDKATDAERDGRTDLQKEAGICFYLNAYPTYNQTKLD